MSPPKICPSCSREYGLDDRFCPVDGAVLRSTEASSNLVGQIIAERYHVVRKLGEGGMGQVYLAEHVRMGRQSAVKVMSPALTRDPDAISRFNREAANASRISHPNVASIYDFGETPEGLIYLAMEYVEGESLTTLLERQGALHPARAAAIVRQTADALSAAHERGIVHRDLKPDNIMLARSRDGGDAVKVVDFGIAKAVGAESQRVTRTGYVVGTPEYMSPEQLSGDPVDARSDVYSLGLVAFTMLTGTLPFPSETAQESMIMRLTERPRSLAEVMPEVAWPDELQRVIGRALERDARARYETASEMGGDFERAITTMPHAPLREASTQRISLPSVPPTRVAPEAGATVILEPQQANAAARPRRTPQIAAAAVIVALAALGVAAMRDRGAASPNGAPVASEIDSGAPIALAETATGAAAGSSSPADGALPDEPVSSRTPSRPAATNAGTRRSAVPGATLADEARRQLDDARTVIEANLQADAVDRAALTTTVASLTRALPALTTFADSVDARYLRAQGLGLTGSTDRSCRELRHLISLALSTRLRTEIETLHATACQ